MTVMALGSWRNNAEMIADVAKLGYLDGHVADITYGLGNFWKEWQPAQLTAHDLTLDGVDFRHLPEGDETFDSCVLDGPYRLAGTPDRPAAQPGWRTEFDLRYGIDIPRTPDERMALIRAGITEAARVLKPKGYLLCKCADQVVSGAVRWQTLEFTEHARSCGLSLVDWFMFQSYRRQPEGRKQVHARRNCSSLLVFKKVKR
jgi:hypothetical protein